MSRSMLEELAWLKDNTAFEERPASIEEFLGDDYLGIEKWVRKRIREELVAIMGAEVDPIRISKHSEACVTGGIGIGKTTVASIVLPYLVHWVLCLKDPQDYFNLLPGSRIAFMMMSTSESQAKEVIFQDVKARINNSKWFQDNYPFDPSFKNQIRFNKDIWILPGDSAETTFEGYNIMGGIIDEGDSHKVTKVKDYAEDGYTTISSRITSRFQDRGFLLAIGQTKRANGFMQRKYNEFLVRPDAYAVRLAIWDSMGEDFYLAKDGGKKFTYDVLRKTVLPAAAAKFVGGKNLILVPELYRRQFEMNPEKALRDLAGIPPKSGNPFISLVDRIEACRDRWISYYGEEPTVDKQGRIPSWFKARDSLRRVAHIDLAYSANGDGCGIAMGHVRESVDIDGERKPYIVIDFAMRLQAMPGTEIFIGDVRQIIYELRNQRGFRLDQVTMDGFQCLTGDTIIPLLDGTSPTIAELANTHPDGGFWTYSYDGDRIVPGRCTRAWRTGDRSVIRVKLDNGEVVRCTPDHPFMLRDGTYRRADQLEPGDSLMPLHRRVTPDNWPGLRGYEQVAQPGRQRRGHRYQGSYRPSRWEFTHRMVGAAGEGDLHHVDRNKRNNAPSNLVRLSVAEHRFHHSGEGNSLTQLWRQPEFRARTGAAVGTANRARVGDQARHRRADVTIADLEAFRGRPWRAAAEALGCTQDVIYDRIRAAGYANWREFKAAVNHKVVSVTDLGECEAVYDLTVEEHHNFAIGAGVFVHNSTDTLQQLAKRRFKTELVSIDKSLLPYSDVRDAIYEGRLEFPPYICRVVKGNDYEEVEIIVQELSELVDQGNKIDHPEMGSKDVSDAIAGVVTTLMGDRRYHRKVRDLGDYRDARAAAAGTPSPMHPAMLGAARSLPPLPPLPVPEWRK